MHITILEKDIETKEVIYVLSDASEIFNTDAINPESCSYYKKNLNYEITLKPKANTIILNLKLITNTVTLDFKKMQNLFLFSTVLQKVQSVIFELRNVQLMN